MTAHLLQALSFVAGLATLYVWERHDVRARLHTTLLAPLKRRAHCARRTLAALWRALSLRPHRPAHAPHRRTHP